MGHNISPKHTPRISDNADFGPPEIVRAIIAIHTGPGVINKIIMHPNITLIVQL